MSIEPAVEWIIEELPARQGRTDGKHWGPIFDELKNGAGTWAIVLREPVAVGVNGKPGNSARWGSHAQWFRKRASTRSAAPKTENAGFTSAGPRDRRVRA